MTSLRASADATNGHWWRAARAMLFFGVLGELTGPLVAFALLMTTGIDPRWVSAIAAIVHTAMLPFTAIGLCLAYRDLQIRAATRRELEATGARTPGVTHRFTEWPRRAIGVIEGRPWRA